VRTGCADPFPEEVYRITDFTGITAQELHLAVRSGCNARRSE